MGKMIAKALRASRSVISCRTVDGCSLLLSGGVILGALASCFRLTANLPRSPLCQIVGVIELRFINISVERDQARMDVDEDAAGEDIRVRAHVQPTYCVMPLNSVDSNRQSVNP